MKQSLRVAAEAVRSALGLGWSLEWDPMTDWLIITGPAGEAFDLCSRKYADLHEVDNWPRLEALRAIMKIRCLRLVRRGAA